jgi:hypothetical protein
MPGAFTNYLENIVLDHIFRNQAYTPPTTVYVALCTADPGEAATGASMNEVANSGGYARTAVTFGAASGGQISNSSAVTFPQATASWGTVTHVALVDSATYGSGNVLAYGALTTSRAIQSGDTAQFAIGALTLSLD